MMQKADIRKCSAADVKEIAEIEKNCIPDGWSEKAFEEWLSGDGRILLGAFADGRMIGFANGSWVIDEGELLNIAVLEEYRQHGTAALLYEQIEKEFSDNGVGTVYLEVREKNTPAIKFYQKNGFEQNGLRKNYYKNPHDNAVLMCKKIIG